MNSYAIVRPEHLNHQGYLFGGQMLKWVDEYAWLCAARDFPGASLVTRAMDNIEFRTRVESGSILRFCVLPQRRGKTSVTYHVDVYADFPGATEELLVFTNNITFVSITENGEKRELPQTGTLRSERFGCSDDN
jgi:acyl-CoA hydrolase